MSVRFFRVRLLVLVSFAFTSLVLIGVYALGLITGTPIPQLTGDPAGLNETKAYIGILSNLGVMLWSATVAICFFGATQLSRDDRRRPFLFSSGLLSLLLMLDDALLLHERAFAVLLPEVGTYMGYAAVFVCYLLYFLRQILATDYLLLVLALLFAILSGIMDLFTLNDLGIFVENGFKFSGIVFWLAYFCSAATRSLRSNVGHG